LNPLWNCIRPDTWLQTKWCKNQHGHPTVWNFVQRLARHGSTVIYRWITLLQRLYRWHHQSLKWWISGIHSQGHKRMRKNSFKSFSKFSTYIGIFMFPEVQ
jgi:hypothetical protein